MRSPLSFEPVPTAPYLYIESNGMPEHPMMIGITAWQQQVPLPQPYTRDNAWRIPLNPVPAKEPVSAKENFFRGAIALAANGVPIFNPIKNDGRTDTFLAGELDKYGGDSGRADDYHYHISPLHLQTILGESLPVAYVLDGYPIYGLNEPDGSKVENLDKWNGLAHPTHSMAKSSDEETLLESLETGRRPTLLGGLIVQQKNDRAARSVITFPVRDREGRRGGEGTETMTNASPEPQRSSPTTKRSSAEQTPVLSSSKPNFIVILIDDMGWKDMGFSGSKINQPVQAVSTPSSMRQARPSHIVSSARNDSSKRAVTQPRCTACGTWVRSGPEAWAGFDDKQTRFGIRQRCLRPC